ncbi:MAG TPA: hypothetical protein ENI36_00790 [Thermoplasmatales archaeon]|nr:hypothetical protein [Thermoplasmatales archaeon]
MIDSGDSGEELRIYIVDGSGITDRVLEGQPFLVGVSEEGDIAVGGASVEVVRDGISYGSNVTASDGDWPGWAGFVAPLVNQNLEFQIIVSKQGFKTNTTSILIVDSSTEGEVLIKIFNSTLNETNRIKENETFYIKVIDKTAENPISNLNITINPVTNKSFDIETKRTDENGVSTFIAPHVDKDEIFNITTTYRGRQYYTLIVILDQPNSLSQGITHTLPESIMLALIAVMLVVAIVLAFIIWKRKEKKGRRVSIPSFTELAIFQPLQEDENPKNEHYEHSHNTNDAKNEEQSSSFFQPLNEDGCNPSTLCSTADYLDKMIDVIINKRKDKQPKNNMDR